MSRLITTTACILLFVTANVQGGSLADLSREYAAQKADFTREYQAQRTALRRAYRRSHDLLIAERQWIARIDCHETRAARLRANSRDLSALARENGRQHRELSLAFTDGLRTLRDEYEFARENYRRARRFPPLTVPSHDVHPADCACTDCVPHAPTHQYDHRGYTIRHFNNHNHAPYRKPNGIDIAVAILSMLR